VSSESPKLDPKGNLSCFHACDNCAGGGDAIEDTFCAIMASLKELSPREAVMVLTSALCEYSASADSPKAALDQACDATKRLFERGPSKRSEPQAKRAVH
jgi:hypothetical protein